jgi:hypothetical protein
MSRESNNDLSDDLIWGVAGEDGIAAFLNLSVGKTYYLIGKGELPVRKFGHRTIVASRRELRRLFTSDTSTAA